MSVLRLEVGDPNHSRQPILTSTSRSCLQCRFMQSEGSLAEIGSDRVCIYIGTSIGGPSFNISVVIEIGFGPSFNIYVVIEINVQ